MEQQQPVVTRIINTAYLARQLTIEKQRQISEEINQFIPRDSDFGNIEDHIIYDTPSIKEIERKRWIERVLKQHGKVTRTAKRLTEVEPWNTVKHTISGEDNMFREELYAEDDSQQAEEQEPKNNICTLDFEEDSGLIKLQAPEAILWFSSQQFEDALDVLETLEDMDTRQRTAELAVLESLEYAVQWTIEEASPLFSCLQQIRYPLDYKKLQAATQ